MKTKHTQGEWVYKNKLVDKVASQKIFCGKKVIVQMVAYEFFGCSISEANANAKLIAAAPELLEALKRFIKFVDNQNLDYESSMVLQAKIAIKKATE